MRSVTTLGNAIAEALERGRLSERQAADQLGVSQQTVNRWIHGAVPGPDFAERLAAFLGLNADAYQDLVDSSSSTPTRRNGARLDHIEAEVADLRAAVTDLTRALLRLSAQLDDEQRGG